MTTSVMIDIVMLAVIAFFGFLGWKRGLLRTLSEFVSIALALFLASQVSAAAAHYAVDNVLRPATEKAVREQVTMAAQETSHTAREKVDGVLDAIPSGLVRQHARELLEKTRLPDTLETAGQEALLSTCLRLTDRVLDTVVYNLLHSLLYALAFAALNTALRFVRRLLRRSVRMPVLRQLNEAGGLLLGVVKGSLLAYAGAWILTLAGVLSAEAVNGSLFWGLTAGWQ